MPRKFKPQFKTGDKVTCKHAVEAYYSKYAGNPEILFEPGTPAVIASITPKVRIAVFDPLRYDGRDEFIVADFYSITTNKTERVGINFCNAVKL